MPSAPAQPAQHVRRGRGYHQAPASRALASPRWRRLRMPLAGVGESRDQRRDSRPAELAVFGRRAFSMRCSACSRRQPAPRLAGQAARACRRATATALPTCCYDDCALPATRVTAEAPASAIARQLLMAARDRRRRHAEPTGEAGGGAGEWARPPGDFSASAIMPRRAAPPLMEYPHAPRRS